MAKLDVSIKIKINIDPLFIRVMYNWMRLYILVDMVLC